MTAPDSRGRFHAPAVRAQAERLGVDLGIVDGTGTGGRVTIANVLAAVKLSSPPPPPPRGSITDRQNEDYLALFGELPPIALGPTRPSAVHRRRPVNGPSAFSNSVEVTVDVTGLNPLLEDAAQSHPCYPLAIQEAEPPTVFNSGNLPPFTASGLPPEVLLELPWQVRHYAASAESKATVLDMVERFADHPQAVRGLDDEYGSQGADDYLNRMKAWLIGPGEDTLA